LTCHWLQQYEADNIPFAAALLTCDLCRKNPVIVYPRQYGATNCLGLQSKGTIQIEMQSHGGVVEPSDVQAKNSECQ
jgi:hypothetical protein